MLSASYRQYRYILTLCAHSTTVHTVSGYIYIDDNRDILKFHIPSY